MSHRAKTVIALAVMTAVHANAQQQAAQASPYELTYAFGSIESQGDFTETIFYGGFHFAWPSLKIEIRGASGMLQSDREATRSRVARADGSKSPPRRGIDPPEPRRNLSPEAMHARVNEFMQALGQSPKPATESDRDLFAVPRFLYFEGDVIVIREGVEVARCRRLWISPQDDRMVIEGAELRYRTALRGGGFETMSVRGEQIEKQGKRWAGRNLTFTTCDAGQPHLAVLSGELEIVESGTQFEVFSRGSTLQFSGTNVLPLPDAHFFTGEQTSLPIRSASIGYSGNDGVLANIEVGTSWNKVGGAAHEWLTGHSANEFRGDWTLDAGLIERRGAPFGSKVDYRAEGLYRGSLEGYYLDDNGPNRREILDYIDGTTIDTRDRNMLRTENKFFLGTDTHVDLLAFHASDPAVYSEFFGGDYRGLMRPESSVYLHSGSNNVLFTIGARTNIDTFSYLSNRALANSFIEELPLATLNLISQPIANTPWGTPIVLDTATEVGQRRFKYDSRFGRTPPENRNPDTTLRIDQAVELSAPFQLGPLNLRPFAATELTFYDETEAGGDYSRLAFSAGVRAGMRFQRTFNWLDAEGAAQAMRHVISPIVTFADRFHVDGQPDMFFQFDQDDALTEQNLVRCEVRNLLERMEGGELKPVTYDFIFLNLAQDFWPDASRDNEGEQLGLAYYDFRLRPRAYWIPFENFAYNIYGEHDWQQGLRALDTEIQFGKVIGCDWTLDYHSDSETDAAVGLGASTSLYDRWHIYGAGQYDPAAQEFLNYTTALIRRDHDYSITFGVNFDNYEDQVSFNVNFEPRLPGMLHAPERGGPNSRSNFQQRAAAGW